MEEAGSTGLHELVGSLKDTFLKDVDYFVISDSYWLSTTKPCLTYGLRGNAYFYVEVECAKKDLHSGRILFVCQKQKTQVSNFNGF